MIELSLQTFGISIEVLFPAPRTFQKELIDIHAQWLTDSVNGFAVPPEQVRLQQTDIVFGYNLSVQLFGGNGHFSLDAQRASLSARNARGRADAELLRQVTDRFLRQFAKENFTVAFAANAFAKADSTTVRDEYVQRYRFDPRIAHPGAVGYLRFDNWPIEVKFTVEPALGLEDNLFLVWTTRFPAGELSAIPDKVVGVFLEAAAVYGLQLRPLI
jgi:hypothetical protein